MFAVPGRLNDTFSEGCNHLIKTNKAVLIESAKDIEYIMGWEEKQIKKEKNKQHTLFLELNIEEKSLVDLLNQYGSMNIDSICNTITLPVSKVSSTLLNLEFKGVLKSLPGTPESTTTCDSPGRAATGLGALCGSKLLECVPARDEPSTRTTKN